MLQGFTQRAIGKKISVGQPAISIFLKNKTKQPQITLKLLRFLNELAFDEKKKSFCPFCDCYYLIDEDHENSKEHLKSSQISKKSEKKRKRGSRLKEKKASEEEETEETDLNENEENSDLEENSKVEKKRLQKRESESEEDLPLKRSGVVLDENREVNQNLYLNNFGQDHFAQVENYANKIESYQEYSSSKIDIRNLLNSEQTNFEEQEINDQEIFHFHPEDEYNYQPNNHFEDEENFQENQNHYLPKNNYYYNFDQY